MQTSERSVRSALAITASGAVLVLFALSSLDVAARPAAGEGSMPEPATASAPQAPARAQSPENLPRVFLYATGGTISNKQGGRLTVEELIESLPNLNRIARGEGEQFANVASGAMTVAMWLDLSKRINARLKNDADLAGVVVTSGTDTLEELAFFLHLTVRDPRPVVIVGSMRNPSTTGYEGVANLEDGFRVAADPASRGMGALVVLNDEINSAREATKTDARLLNTFSSRGYGVLGTVLDQVEYFRKPIHRSGAGSEFDVSAMSALPRVDVIITYQEAPGDLIEAAVDHGAKGIVIAGAGAGATSGTQSDGIRYALEKGVFVVTTTRTGGGSVGGGRGRGGTTPRVSGGDLQPIKARILLMLALATTGDVGEVQRIFSEY
jgi:L-asparaginase